MRVLSEQSNTKLRILPADINVLSDEEFMRYIEELRGNRGRVVRKATAKDGSSTTKTKRPPKPKSDATHSDIADDIEF